MKIRLEPAVAIALETMAAQAVSQEFSGMGFLRVDTQAQEFVVYDVVPMHVGSYSYTEIHPEKILPLLSRSDAGNLKLWWHRHPLGDGIPGSHNWSGTDERTATQEPMGGTPELVGWSVAIVRTPLGWVGRVDDHRKHKTQHLEVIGQASRELYQQMRELYRSTPVQYGSNFNWPEGKLDPTGYRQLNFIESADDMVDDIAAVSNYLLILDDVETHIGKAQSLAQFDHADALLRQYEDEIVDNLNDIPPVLINRIAELNDALQQREYELLYEEIE